MLFRSLEHDFGNLSYQAYRDNRDYVLKGRFKTEGPVAEAASDAQQNQTGRRPTTVLQVGDLAQLPPVAPIVPKLKVPAEWEVVVTEPIYFFSSGFCRGGRIEVVVGKQRFQYRLEPPTCELVVE